MNVSVFRLDVWIAIIKHEAGDGSYVEVVTWDRDCDDPNLQMRKLSCAKESVTFPRSRHYEAVKTD